MAEESNTYAGPERRYSGPERRECMMDQCLEHSGHIVTLKSLGDRVGSIEESKPVSFNHFKWMVGIIVTALITIFSMILYNVRETKDELTQIRIQQERTLNKIESIQDRIKRM